MLGGKPWGARERRWWQHGWEKKKQGCKTVPRHIQKEKRETRPTTPHEGGGCAAATVHTPPGGHNGHAPRTSTDGSRLLHRQGTMASHPTGTHMANQRSRPWQKKKEGKKKKETMTGSEGGGAGGGIAPNHPLHIPVTPRRPLAPQPTLPRSPPIASLNKRRQRGTVFSSTRRWPCP